MEETWYILSLFFGTKRYSSDIVRTVTTKLAYPIIQSKLFFLMETFTIES